MKVVFHYAFLFLFGFFATSIIAAPKKAKELPEESSSEGSSSSDIRTNQQFGLGLLYTPLSDFVLTSGAYASYNVSPDLSVGGFFLVGSKDLSSEETTNTTTYKLKADLNGTLAQASARYFVGNSFNITSGLSYRAATFKYSIESSTGTLVDGKIVIQSIAIPFFIGNMWTWKSGFTLGCDWIGVQVPISGSAKSSLSGTLDTQTAQDLNDEALKTGDKLAKATSLTLLLTSVGWAF